MNQQERYVRCRGRDVYDSEVFGSCYRKKVKIILSNGIQEPVDCAHLAADKRDRREKGRKLPPIEGLCSAVGADKPDKWGYCPYVRVI